MPTMARTCHRNGLHSLLMMASGFLCIWSCGTSTRLIGEPVDGAWDGGPEVAGDGVGDDSEDGEVESGDGLPDGIDFGDGSDRGDWEPEEAATEDGVPEDAGVDDASDGEAASDCPVWAVPSGIDPLEDGTEEIGNHV